MSAPRTAPTIIDIPNVDSLEERIEQVERSSSSPLLFRGQSNSTWSLETSLERLRKHGMLFADYYQLVSRVRPEIESVTGKYWMIPPFDEVRKSLEQYDD